MSSAQIQAPIQDTLQRSALKPWIFLALIAALIVAAVTLPVADWAERFVTSVRGHGALGVGLYALVYIVATVLFLPCSLLTIGAGFIYGVWGGFALVLPASLAGALLAFVLGRGFAREWIVEKTALWPRLRALDSAIGERSFAIIFLLRLSPLVPFGLLNYFLGVTKARPRDYVVASATGMIPGVFLYVYIGSLVTNAAQIVSGDRPSSGLAGNLLLYGGLAATVVVSVVVSRLARRRLDEEVH